MNVSQRATWAVGLAAALALVGCAGRRSSGSYEKGVKALEAGRLEDAERHLRQTVAEAPKDGEAQACLGVVLWHSEKWAAAAAAFRRAAELLPSDSRPLEFIADIHMRDKRWSRAAGSLEEALARSPDNPRILTTMATLHLHRGDAEAAKEQLEMALEAEPTYAPALYNLAFVQYKWLGETDGARTRFQDYLRFAADTDHMDRAQQAIGKIQASTGTSGDAPDEEERRNAAVLEVERGLRHYEDDAWDKAAERFRLAVAKDEDYASAHYNLGLAYLAMDDLDNAEEAFRAAVRLAPEKRNGAYNLALALYRKRDSAAAKDVLEGLLEAYPSHAEAHFLIGHIYAQDDSASVVAAGHYRQFVQLSSDNPRVQATRAWLEQRADETD